MLWSAQEKTKQRWQNNWPLLIPPCFSSLYLQKKWANFVSKLWKNTCIAQLILPNIEEQGWNTDGSIAWILDLKILDPEDIWDMLMNDENKSEDGNNNNKESKSRKVKWKVKQARWGRIHYLLICVINKLYMYMMLFIQKIHKGYTFFSFS